MKLRHAVALFGLGDFILQFCAFVLGAFEPPVSRSAFHPVRMAVLAPLDLVPARVWARVPAFQNGGLYTLFGMLLLNTLICTMFFYLCVRAICSVRIRYPN
jgi:hypothetical protein